MASYNPNTIIDFLYFLIFILSVYLSLKMDTHLRQSSPDLNPYAFGYFIGFVGVLIVPVSLLGHYYFGASNILKTNLPVELVFAIVSIGILYRRNLPWIFLILGNLCLLLAPLIIPMMRTSTSFMGDLIGKNLPFDEAYETIVNLIFLFVVTLYFLKRRKEMSFI